MLIFDVDIHLLHNKVFHYVLMACFSCHMQGSPLMTRNKCKDATLKTIVTDSEITYCITKVLNNYDDGLDPD